MWPWYQDLRDKHPHLFEGTQADAMVLFMRQDDIIGVLRFIDACLERILYTSDSPEMAGKDVMNLSLSIILDQPALLQRQGIALPHSAAPLCHVATYAYTP